MNQNQEKISLKYLFDTSPYKDYDVICTGLSGSEKAYFVNRLYMKHRAPVVVVTSSTKEAETYLEDLDFFAERPCPPLIYFPPYNITPFKYLSYHNETAAKRIRSLYQLIVGDVPPMVVTTISALMQRNLPKQELCDYAELIMVEEGIDRDRLVDKLISSGYERSSMVEEPGDFSIRGGILDIFSPLYSDPIRIELFGDTVESIRFFSAVTQRTIKNIREAVILPARETILKSAHLTQVINRIRKQSSHLNIPVTKIRDLIHRIRKDGVFPGIESLIPLIYPHLDSFFD
ncbi:MAG: transcription-repair coupling factor, partial [Desulfobacteraceae bacterium]|nr:transcription-repair coupling factor [Desulfobacteraceae bacterium]